MVSLRDVHFAYSDGPFALDVAQLDVPRGARVACVGPSGSGKSTLAALMTGIRLPDRGSIALDGRELTTRSDAERRALRIARVGMMFQEFELVASLSALENVLLPYHVADADELRWTPAVVDRARDLAERVGLHDVLDRKPQRLSGGERQRVALCRALVTRPALVLCDEPTGQLDPVTAAASLDRIFEQVDAEGATLFVITHDHALLPRFDDVVDMTELAAPREVA